VTDNSRTQPSISDKKPRKPPKVLLVGLVAMTLLPVNIILASTSALITDLKTTASAIQIAYMVFIAGVGFGQLIFGLLSDSYGRKRILVLGLLVFVLGSIVGVISDTFWAFLTARLMQALGAAAGSALARAIIFDTYGEEASSITGYAVMSATITASVSPIIGEVLQQVGGWKSIFAVLGGSGIILLAGCVFYLEETRPSTPEQRTERSASWIAPLGSSTFRRGALFSSLLSGSWYAFVAGVPMVVMVAWHQPSSQFVAWWTMNSASYMLGSFLAGRYAGKKDDGEVMRAGAILVGVGAVLFVVAGVLGTTHPLGMFGPMAFILMGSGLAQPVAMTIAVRSQGGHNGAASGLLGGIQILTGLLCISLTTILPLNTVLPVALVCGLSAIGAVAAYYLPRKL
jgi:DHA1 family bicyclomycin/chloramphenicol resistance-like MFS transporter